MCSEAKFAQLCLTLCDPMNCSTPGLLVHHQLPEFTGTHVHWVGDAIQPCHPLSSPSPPTLNLSQYQGLFKWVSSLHQVTNGLHSPWNSPGQNTGVGSLSLLQGIFLTQGSNPGLLHCRWILYQLSHKGKPRNTGVGSLSLLQWIFLTQELNWGLL